MAGISFDSEKIDRFFKGEYSDDDASYVDEIFCDNIGEKELKNYLSGQFYGLLPEADLEKKNLDHILYRIHYDINTRLSEQKALSFDNIVKWNLRIAGIITLPLLLFAGIQTYKEAGLKKET